MKILAIARKDLRRTFRSPFMLAFMFVLPLMEAGIPYRAFGNAEMGVDLRRTRVQLVNLDQPVKGGNGFSAGTMLVEYLHDENLAELLDVAMASTSAEAVRAVDGRQADVAVIIPIDFSASLMDSSRKTDIALYFDPALTVGPAVVREILRGFIDGFRGSFMAGDIAAARFRAAGIPATDAVIQQARAEYGRWAQAIEARMEKGERPGIEILSSAVPPEDQRGFALLAGPVLLGMMVFFVFFIGASAAQSVVREMEEGTLSRMFTTPIRRATILIGKFLAVGMTLLVQMLGLVLAGNVLMHVDWGEPGPAALAGFSMVVAASGFGIFFMSWMQNSRRTFLVMGGGMGLMGIAGGCFTTTFQNLPSIFKTVSLFTPQGWTLRGWEIAMRGGRAEEMVLPTAMSLGMGIVFLAGGIWNLRNRMGRQPT
jgi:ABC-2 type transport system permease protein